MRLKVSGGGTFMDDLSKLYDAVLSGDAASAKRITEQALTAGIEPMRRYLPAAACTPAENMRALADYAHGSSAIQLMK